MRERLIGTIGSGRHLSISPRFVRDTRPAPLDDLMELTDIREERKCIDAGWKRLDEGKRKIATNWERLRRERESIQAEKEGVDAQASQVRAIEAHTRKEIFSEFWRRLVRFCLSKVWR